jgi:hypothetical protein
LENLQNENKRQSEAVGYETGVICDHCWHQSNIMLMSNPPQIKEVCCHCGKEQTRFINTKIPDNKTHGKYKPSI